MSDVERLLRGLDEAAEFAKTYRFEITAEYLQWLALVEGLPANQPGADKSAVWPGMESFKQFFRAARPSPHRR